MTTIVTIIIVIILLSIIFNASDDNPYDNQ